MKRSTLADEIYSILVGRIISGKLRPGAALVEADLARELDVSSTPVRAAIEQLVTQGLVCRRIHVGCTVACPSLRQHADIRQVREAIEGLAASVMASQGTDEALEELGRIHQAIVRAVARDDSKEYIVRHFEFHRQILRGCGNDYIVGAANAEALVLLSLFEDQPIGSVGLSRAIASGDSHAVVYQAIVDRDPAAAERLMREHVRAGWKVVCEAMEGRQSQAHAGCRKEVRAPGAQSKGCDALASPDPMSRAGPG